MREEEFLTGFLFTLFIIIIVAFATGFLSETYIKTKIPLKIEQNTQESFQQVYLVI